MLVTVRYCVTLELLILLINTRSEEFEDLFKITDGKEVNWRSVQREKIAHSLSLLIYELYIGVCTSFGGPIWIGCEAVLNCRH